MFVAHQAAAPTRGKESTGSMKIYNLFPRLAGRFDGWTPHLERASRMGFDWVFVNPIQRLGQSRSLYSIADHFAINETFVSPDSGCTPEEQVRAVIAEAEGLGMAMMIDLVINHCAKDSQLVHKHPDWFVRDGNAVASAFCVESDGNRVVWHDLAQFDHRGSPDRAGLLAYCIEMVEYLIDLGFRGFRCDAAYQIPKPVWEHLIARVRKTHPAVVFVAETLGCSPDQTRETAAAGFDAIFNSSNGGTSRAAGCSSNTSRRAGWFPPSASRRVTTPSACSTNPAATSTH